MGTDPYSNPVVWIRPVSSWQLQRVQAVVIIVFTGAVRASEKDNITGSPFSRCPSPQNTIIVNEKVSLLVMGGAADCVKHTQGQCSFPELPLGWLGHSWMKRFTSPAFLLLSEEITVISRHPIKNNGLEPPSVIYEPSSVSSAELATGVNPARQS